MAIIVGSETQRFKPSRFDVLPPTLLTFLLDSSDVSWNSENKEKIAYLLKVFFVIWVRKVAYYTFQFYNVLSKWILTNSFI